MARAFLIAEKPSLMREILAVYKTMTLSDTIDFAAFAGHTMTLASPGDYKPEWGEKKWNWEMLPIIPDAFTCKVANGKEKLFHGLKSQLQSGNYDYIINACDPDREGQAIFQYFIDSIGCTLPVKRFWTNDLTETSIAHTLQNLREAEEPFLANLTTASKLRGQFDWLVGMNLTVASSLQMHGTAKVGRVKTPTLKIIVDRELDILNFKPSSSYEVVADFGSYMGTYFDEEGLVRFKTEAEALKLAKTIGTNGVITSIEKKTETTYAPQLYSLSTLQTDASKAHGFTAEETKSLVQSLYERKLLSYPRTDNPYISTELAKKFPILLKALAHVPGIQPQITTVLADTKQHLAVAKNKRYVNDAKMAESGHYAIVPTGTPIQPSALSADEQKIVDLVARRFVAIFLPPMKVSKTTIITTVDDVRFRTTGKTLLDAGFSTIFDTKSTDTLLPTVKKGSAVTVQNTSLNEKVSTAPQRFTDGTLISTMENPVKYLLDAGLKSTMKENKGIGTTATRDNIINELVANGYIEKKKGRGKVEQIYATQRGISIIQNLNNKQISSVDLTGIWEEKLSEVEQGNLSDKEFHAQMVSFVLDSIQEIRGTDMSFLARADAKIEVLGGCPKCGQIVKEGKDYYLCSAYRNTCDFIVRKEMFGAQISKAEIKKLLSGKETKVFDFTRTNNDGTKQWQASLTYDSESGRVVFAGGNNSSAKKHDDLSCPKCGKPLKETQRFFLCESYKNGCDFLLPRTLSGADITLPDVQAILNGQTVEKQFIWKSGKTGRAGVKLIDYKLEFVFK